MRWADRFPGVDNLDIDLSAVVPWWRRRPKRVAKMYERWTKERAARNLSLVEMGVAHLEYGFSDPIDVWHINSQLFTLPALARALQGAGVLQADRGLDVGCGTVTLFEFFSVRDAVLADLSPDYVKFQLDRGWHAIEANVEQLPFADSSFDLVVASDILEHVLSLSVALSEIRRVLSDGGHLAVNVPWEQDLFSMSALELGSHIRRFDDENLMGRFVDFKLLSKEVIEKRSRPSRIKSANLIFQKRKGAV